MPRRSPNTRTQAGQLLSRFLRVVAHGHGVLEVAPAPGYRLEMAPVPGHRVGDRIDGDRRVIRVIFGRSD